MFEVRTIETLCTLIALKSFVKYGSLEEFAYLPKVITLDDFIQLSQSPRYSGLIKTLEMYTSMI